MLAFDKDWGIRGYLFSGLGGLFSNGGGSYFVRSKIGFLGFLLYLRDGLVFCFTFRLLISHALI
jgi:hypothetical protein